MSATEPKLIDKRQTAETPPSAGARILIYCAGADWRALQVCPHLEQLFIKAIGTLVLFTAGMAAISGGYALFAVFQSPGISFALGPIWGLLILHIDRFLIMSVTRIDREHWARRWALFAFRIALGIAIALAVARPLEVRLFQPEIMDYLTDRRYELINFIHESFDKQAAAIAHRYAVYNEQLKRDRGVLVFQLELDEARSQRRECEKIANELKERHLDECVGKMSLYGSTTEIYGDGPECKRTDAAYKEKREDCQRLRELERGREIALEKATSVVAASLAASGERQQNEIASVEAQRNARVEDMAGRRLGSFFSMHSALSELTRKRDVSSATKIVLPNAADGGPSAKRSESDATPEGHTEDSLGAAARPMKEKNDASATKSSAAPARQKPEFDEEILTINKRAVAIQLALWVITAIFVVVEISPIGARFLSPLGSYERKTQNEHDIFDGLLTAEKNIADMQISRREAEAKAEESAATYQRAQSSRLEKQKADAVFAYLSTEVVPQWRPGASRNAPDDKKEYFESMDEQCKWMWNNTTPFKHRPIVVTPPPINPVVSPSPDVRTPFWRDSTFVGFAISGGFAPVVGLVAYHYAPPALAATALTVSTTIYVTLLGAFWQMKQIWHGYAVAVR